MIFRWSSWYVWGWCKHRTDFRLFKLNRIDQLAFSDTVFIKRNVPLPDLTNEQIFSGGIRVKALFETGCKWRLVEEFGTSCYQEQEDGRLLFQADYTDKDNLITWLLSFRDQAELLEPVELRQELTKALKRVLAHYESNH